MAISIDPKKVSVHLMLNVGMTESGKVATKSVSLGSLNVNTYDDQKAANLIQPLGALLDHEVYSVIKKTEGEFNEE